MLATFNYRLGSEGPLASSYSFAERHADHPEGYGAWDHDYEMSDYSPYHFEDDSGFNLMNLNYNGPDLMENREIHINFNKDTLDIKDDKPWRPAKKIVKKAKKAAKKAAPAPKKKPAAPKMPHDYITDFFLNDDHLHSIADLEDDMDYHHHFDHHHLYDHVDFPYHHEDLGLFHDDLGLHSHFDDHHFDHLDYVHHALDHVHEPFFYGY